MTDPTLNDPADVAVPIADHGGRWLFDPASGAMTLVPDDAEAAEEDHAAQLPATPVAGPAATPAATPAPDPAPSDDPERAIRKPAKADTVKGS